MDKERVLFESMLTENTLYYMAKEAAQNGDQVVHLSRSELLDLYLTIKNLRRLADPESWEQEQDERRLASILYYHTDDAESAGD